MIYDRIDKIERYIGLSPWFDKAIEFITTTDLTILPLGRHDIDKDHVFVTVMEADTKGIEDLHFEIHKKYWDLQMDLEGTESLLIGLDNGTQVKAYQEDIAFYNCEEWIHCVLGLGRFVVCMANEPHKPGVSYGDQKHVKKCVFKIEA